MPFDLASSQARRKVDYISLALNPFSCQLVCSDPFTPWVLLAFAIGCATTSVISICLAVSNYLTDTYHRYASSALVGQSFCKSPCLFLLRLSIYLIKLIPLLFPGRNMLEGAFPLVTNATFTNLGYPAASSLLGGIVRC
jgi:hypothetical protein